MKKYFAPELETAKFLAEDVITVSSGTAQIIGGDTYGNDNKDDAVSGYNSVIDFDWSQANWD